jgi:hypothetical protein
MAPKKLRPPLAQRCAFCGGKADSREHLWPEWALKRVTLINSEIGGELDGVEWPRSLP